MVEILRHEQGVVLRIGHQSGNQPVHDLAALDLGKHPAEHVLGVHVLQADRRPCMAVGRQSLDEVGNLCLGSCQRRVRPVSVLVEVVGRVLGKQLVVVGIDDVPNHVFVICQHPGNLLVVGLDRPWIIRVHPVVLQRDVLVLEVGDQLVSDLLAGLTVDVALRSANRPAVRVHIVNHQVHGERIVSRAESNPLAACRTL